MSSVYERLTKLHQRWLTQRQPEQPVHIEQARVLLVASGYVGLHSGLALQKLGLAQLTIFGVHQNDLSIWAPTLKHVQLPVVPKPFNANNFGIVLNNYDLVVLAVDRPYPVLAERMNAICYRNKVAWTQLVTWGNAINLGPSVLPGITACYECYQRRIQANEVRQDVGKAREQFFHSDTQWTLKGQLQALNATAALYLQSEVKRLLTAEHPPLALSREVQWDWLRSGHASHHVTPAEYCSVCGGLQTALHTHTQTLEHVIQELVPQAQPSEVLV